MTTTACPKCGTGRLSGDRYNYVTDVITCYSCGLFHAVGASKESLHRQVIGHDPRVVEARREVKS